MEINKINYNPWPNGLVPKDLQRKEPDIIKEMGYGWEDPRDIIDMFERKLAYYFNSKYAITTDCCTHAIELCFRYLIEKGELDYTDKIFMPKNTYISAAQVPIRLGFDVLFEDIKWSGFYSYSPTRIFDAATMYKECMYDEIGDNESLVCVSFQIKKKIPIGKGGVILTNDKKAASWLKLASYDGRDLSTPYDSKDHIKTMGYHYYMTPEDAARGIMLMDSLDEKHTPANWQMYPDVEKMLKF